MITAHGLARLGRDVELRYTPSGDAVANLSLAFSYGKKGEDGKRPTTWVDASLWGKRAEALAPYLLRGGQVCVTLEDLHMETYTSTSGGGTKLAGRVADIDLAGGPPEHGVQGVQQAAPSGPPAAQRGRMPAQAARPQPGFDDAGDIPF